MQEKMRFFVELKERECVDPNERAAMMRHRLLSLRYQAQLLADGHAVYAFRKQGALHHGVVMFQVGTLGLLDKLLKADPLWPYCWVEVQPVLGTEAMAKEIEEFLGEKILSAEEYAQLHWDVRQIRADGEYWLAWKLVPPFSPLMSVEAQNDVYRRTVVSQKAHQSPNELNDENPVGKSVGILVFEGSYEQLTEHCTHCDVYRDSEIRYERLETLDRARALTEDALRAKGWTVDSEPARAAVA